MAIPTEVQAQVRAARRGDAPALAEIYLASAQHHVRLDPSLYTEPDLKEVVERYRHRFPRPSDAEILVADVAGEVVGWVEVILKRADGEPRMNRELLAADIDIAVLPDYRDLGIGTQLMCAAEEWALDHGADIMTLDTHIANSDAHRFYQDRHGWRTSGLFMTKRPERNPN
jgi:GNAT superfamily N-acetyltransferase